MSPRRFPALHIAACVAVALPSVPSLLSFTLLGCGNIGLSASSFTSPASTGYDVQSEGGADATASSVLLPDAAADSFAPAFLGSPLCSLPAAGSVCDPDAVNTETNATCDYQRAQSADAGLPLGSGDAGTFGCHIERGDGGVAPVCTVAGLGGEGSPCADSYSCASGYECVAADNGRSVCRHYCCQNQCGGPDAGATAAAGAFCDIEPIAPSGTIEVPVCVTKAPCTLFHACLKSDGTPDLSETCTIVDKYGTTACVAKGPLHAGDSCEMEHCGENLACWGQFPDRKCAQLCDKSQVVSPCPSGQVCQGNGANFKDSTIGVCAAQ